MFRCTQHGNYAARKLKEREDKPEDAIIRLIILWFVQFRARRMLKAPA